MADVERTVRVLGMLSTAEHVSAELAGAMPASVGVLGASLCQ